MAMPMNTADNNVNTYACTRITMISSAEIPTASGTAKALQDARCLERLGREHAAWDDLLGYCANSANPVGRIVLYLSGYRDSRRQELSDATCTALQLANFWQDVRVDLEKDRVYLPLEVLRRHGIPLDDLFARRCTSAFRSALREAVGRTRDLFQAGLPLSRTVDKRLAVDLDLFSRGGLRMLQKIEEQDYDVLSRRPVISRTERVRLLLGSILRMAFPRAA